MDEVWIDDWIHWTHCSHLVNTLHISLLHTHSLSSLPLLRSGFHRRKFPFLWVPELSPCISYQLQAATAHNNLTPAVIVTHRASFTDRLTRLLKLKLTLKLRYYRRSVGQSVLVSGFHLGPMIRVSFRLTIPCYFMSGALSDERMGL
jgi:hypothetical protein